MKEIRGRDKFSKYKKTLNYFSTILRYLPLKVRKFFFNLFRNTNGILGIGIRFILLKSIAKECGDNISVHRGVILLSPENLILGKNISIHPMCYIDATGGITIGDDVSIAHGTTILSSTHTFEDLIIPIKDQPLVFNETKIHKNVWVGCKATILAGVTINSGSIIGANSLVNKDVSGFQIVGGVPTECLRIR